jgi:hypothetical protein
MNALVQVGVGEVIASRKTTGGAILVQRLCCSCKHAFWSAYNEHKSACADCDPPAKRPESRGIGRNLDRKVSDRQYHGKYDE